jgi:hypothetical protein
VDERVAAIVSGQQVRHWLEVKFLATEEHRYRQENA